MESVMARVAKTCKIVRSWGVEMGIGCGCFSTDEEEDVWVCDSEGFASSIAVSISVGLIENEMERTELRIS